MNIVKYQENPKQKLSLLILIILFTTVAHPLILTNQNHISLYSNETGVLSSEDPILNLTYYTSTNLTETPIESNSLLAGDHVTIKSAWTPSIVNRSRLEVFAPAIPATLTEDLDTHTLTIDTRFLGNNATCTINATAWLTNGSIVVQSFTNVYIGNFFVPKIKVTSPNGGEEWTGINNITWTASDVNTADSLRYDVLLSSDEGKSYDPLANSITRTWFEWNCTSLDKLDTYVVKVRVTDGIYFSSDISDSAFTAGEVVYTTTLPTTSTTTDTTTTDTTTTTLDPRLTAFVVILVLSSSIMAMVVYYAARKWF